MGIDNNSNYLNFMKQLAMKSQAQNAPPGAMPPNAMAGGPPPGMPPMAGGGAPMPPPGAAPMQHPPGAMPPKPPGNPQGMANHHALQNIAMGGLKPKQKAPGMPPKK